MNMLFLAVLVLTHVPHDTERAAMSQAYVDLKWDDVSDAKLKKNGDFFADVMIDKVVSELPNPAPYDLGASKAACRDISDKLLMAEMLSVLERRSEVETNNFGRVLGPQLYSICLRELTE